VEYEELLDLKKPLVDKEKVRRGSHAHVKKGLDVSGGNDEEKKNDGEDQKSNESFDSKSDDSEESNKRGKGCTINIDGSDSEDEKEEKRDKVKTHVVS
jgi:hypothetical protein